MSKQPFDIELVMSRIADVVRPFPAAALFELAKDGFNTAFELLMACIISIRTRDEVTLPTARKLLACARTPLEVSKLTPLEIGQTISSCTFGENKARQIHQIATRIVNEYNGVLPCEAEVLLSFNGVGPKCANLVLGIACQQPYIGVDIHVHRITNRWGYINAATPIKTMEALTAQLPTKYWVDINRLLVPFGKHICTSNHPHCAVCSIADMCQQIGVPPINKL